MYALASKIYNLPVLSLQSADTLTSVQQLILQPDSLTLVALGCANWRRNQKQLVIMVRDIRQIALDCILVDGEEMIGEASEVVRLSPLLQRPYDARGKTVVTEMKRSLGKVDDYTINLDTYAVQKLYVRQTLLHSWLGASLVIDRSQIVDVTSREIIVRDAVVTQAQRNGWLGPKPIPKQ